MAIVHNKAGQHGKGEADRRFRRWLGGFYWIGVGAGFLLGAFLTHKMTWTTIGVFSCTMAGCVMLVRKMEPFSEKWTRERIKYMRGAQGEALVAWLLQSLEDDWHVFNNIQLEEASDLDHVVVGPGGVWCISTKSHRGLLTLAQGGQLELNHKPVNWLAATKAQAMCLRDRLQALLGRDVPYITPMLAAPLMFIDFRSPCQQVYVVHQEEVTGPMMEAKRRLKKDEVARLVEALEMIAKSAKGLYRRPEKAVAE